jgi:hypothetical protein
MYGNCNFKKNYQIKGGPIFEGTVGMKKYK